MVNHPKKSRGESSSKNPSPEKIKATRKSASLTQTEAAMLVHSSCRSWQQWEAQRGEKGHRRMHPAFWELFNISMLIERN